MPWYRHADGTAVLDYPYRRPSKADPRKTVATHRTRKTDIPYEDTRRVAVAYARFVESLEGSLTARDFGALIEHYRSGHPGEHGLGSYLRGLELGLGKARLDRRFAERWAIYLSRLRAEPYRKPGWQRAKLRSPSTIAKYIATCRAVLRYAYETGLLDAMPIRRWELPESPARDRVLSADEELRLLNATAGDWLHWPIRFALRNPIRKGDLFGLRWESVDLTVPWVTFWPAKTADQDKPSRLPCIGDDPELLDYFSQPHGYPTVFPRWVAGEPGPVGDFKRHWHTVLRLAGIRNFRFHDLRHCATRYMLDQGWTIEEMLRLKIHGTIEMVRRYDHADQRAIVRGSSSFVAGRGAANG